jgi:hypothetical protein
MHTFKNCFLKLMSANTLYANLARNLENDNLSLDSEIEGIICGIRLNKIR